MPVSAGSHRPLIADLVRYGLASAAALTFDFGILVFLTSILGIHYLLAAALGFCAGLLLIYFLCIRFIFASRRRFHWHREFAGFAAIGVAGLAVNELLMFVFVGIAALPVALAKVPTAGIVFLFNFLARRSMLFPASRQRG
ncbi:MAG: GtrA family protein [Flavobacteriaceae bacterium]